MNDLEKEFDKKIREWDSYCVANAHNAFMNSRTNCEAFYGLVEMGKDILPLVKRTYIGDQGRDILNHLPLLIKVLAKEEFVVPEYVQGNKQKIRCFTIDWLEEHVI